MEERDITYEKSQHDLAVELNIAHLKGEVVEFMFRHQNYAEVRDFVGSKVCGITGAQHLMLTCEDGTRSDWFGEDAPDCCRNCANASANFKKSLPPDFFAESETVIVAEGVFGHRGRGGALDLSRTRVRRAAPEAGDGREALGTACGQADAERMRG